jgi:Fe-S-cluster containining protein
MDTSKDTPYFTKICIEQCGGLCCDPWWGIISYTMAAPVGLSDLRGFRNEVVKGIREREQRIVKAYKTEEDEPRPLFEGAERYNVKVRGIKAEGGRLRISMLAMFAFRCRHFSPERTCTIHPSLLGGREIRPPHCGFLGTPDAAPDERGYCRIIHAAQNPTDTQGAIRSAIDLECGANAKHHDEGAQSVEEAADRVIDQLRGSLKDLKPKESAERPGRNDPCICGSGKKFKKCHGR